MKILIVEDELKTLNGIASLIMEIPGDYEVVGRARSGEKGIDLACKTEPDIIITDIRMGGMSGLEMIKRLHALKIQSRYIILSGYAEFQYAREAITLGSMDYLRKKTYAYGDLREALICMTAAILYAIRKASYGLYENISSLNILEWVKDILFLENYPRIIMNVMLQYEQYTKNLKSGNHPIINKVLQILEKEYRNELPLEEMAQRMNVTPEYLSSLFMKELGIKYTTYRAQIRIDVAKRLLQEGKLKIYEVAEASGFPDVKYFTKVFKKYTGTSPGEYVRNLV